MTGEGFKKPRGSNRLNWIADLSQVAYKLYHLNSFSVCFASLLLKVLGDKVLPLVCLITILVYWTLGLSLPSTKNNLEGKVSDCVSLF